MKSLPQASRRRATNLLLVPLVSQLLAGCLLATVVAAQEKSAEAEDKSTTEEQQQVLAGHSAHGEIFNEGPRQAAVLIEGTGDIDFPVTTKSADAQKFFNQGVGQLHGFWYFEAERSFREVLRIDPDCAMAYWGLAMANFDNKDRAPGFVKKASERKDAVSEREQLWIASLVKYFEKPDGEKNARRRELVRDLEKIVLAHPDDIEAKAFLLYQIYSNSKEKDGYKIPSHVAIDLFAAAIHERRPNHPCHHYRIHLWDSEKPAMALDSAAKCGPAAPGIAHMWHMPGHTYSKLYRYNDAAWQQEASARVDHAHQIRFGLIPDQIHNFAHNNEWLIRNLVFVGRYQDAVDLAKNMIELPRLPKFTDGGKKWNHSGSSWAYGRIRLRDILVDFEQWQTLLQLAETDYLKPGPDTIDQREWNRMVGAAAFVTGDAARGRELLGLLRKELAEREKARDKAVADADKKNREAGKSEKEIETATKKAKDNFSQDITALTNNVNELTVCELIYPGADSKLPEADRKVAADLLAKLKTVSKPRLAQLYLKLGDNDKAAAKIEEAVKEASGQVLPLAHKVEILFAVGKREEAGKAFEELRVRAANADLAVPVFDRVLAAVRAAGDGGEALADEKKYAAGADWRAEAKTATDLGERPPLDQLGPFRWSPQAAPDWTLSDGDGKAISLAGYRDKGTPVLVVFYLGKGCVHCMEQLQTFSPMQEKFAASGIAIVAIGTDNEAGLRDTYEQTNDGVQDPFPFPLLSNESCDTFRAYRAFDDFEATPLHGTFLIDATGRIRWSDISYQPFMKPDWLLEECQRLLSLDSGN